MNLINRDTAVTESTGLTFRYMSKASYTLNLACKLAGYKV